MRTRGKAPFVAILFLASHAIPEGANAQQRRADAPGIPVLLVSNVVLGGVSAGIGRRISGGSFLRGAAEGAVGGAIVFAGRRIIASEGSFSAWTGRQIAAVGSSQVRNASAGRPILSEIILPLGPSRIYIQTTPDIRVSPKLDFSGTLAIIGTAARRDTWFDWKESLRVGAVVFLNDGLSEDSGPEGPGKHVAGVLNVRHLNPLIPRGGRNFTLPGVTTHELLHASQYDFASIVWGEPMERWLLGQVKGGHVVHKYVDFGVVVPVWRAANAVLDWWDRPWEREAHSLAPGN